MTDSEKAYEEGRQWARWLPSVKEPPVSVNSKVVNENWADFVRGWMVEKTHMGGK